MYYRTANATYLLVLDTTRNDNLTIQVTRACSYHFHLHFSIINEKFVAHLRSLYDFWVRQQNPVIGPWGLIQVESKYLTNLSLKPLRI